VWLIDEFKNMKDRIKRYTDKESVLDLTYNYNHVYLDKVYSISDTVSVEKNKNDLILFVKKPNWKKCIGIHRDYLSDSQGNDFPTDSLYKGTITEYSTSVQFVYGYNVPNKLVTEMFDELIRYKNDIEEFLKQKIKEEYYK